MMLEKLSSYIYKNPEFLLALSRFESKLLQKKTADIKIVKPVYVTGLARSGTTITLEFLSAHKEFASHSYSDYPFVLTPYFWNNLNKFFVKKTEKYERAHRDGMMVNSASPESMEEMIWAQFFPDLHNPLKNNCMDAGWSNGAFESFYAEHIRKLLYTKKGERYLSKANYNLSRIPYILSQFSDALFIVMVRSPVDFVASSIKQDKMFSEEQLKDKEKLTHTNVTQHYEFGLNKKPINFCDEKFAREILEKFKEGNQAEAWAEYWVSAYGHVLKLMENDAMAKHIKIVRYEDMCENVMRKLRGITSFCDVKEDLGILNEFEKKIQRPSYYTPDLSVKEIQMIKDITRDTARKFNYEF